MFHYEIITVLDGQNLIDEESYQRRYWTRDGQPLTPGHYVALWDESVESYLFDERATYVGPCRSSREAALVLRRLLRARPAQDTRPAETTDRLHAAA